MPHFLKSLKKILYLRDSLNKIDRSFNIFQVWKKQYMLHT